MDALGLIETKGLIAAVESADAMLKAAEVSLLERTFVGGGLVTIAVTGDVGAVKASVDAGAAAVTHLGTELLISQHVIPRPHNELSGIIVADTPLKDRPSEDAGDAEAGNETEAEEIKIEETEDIAEEPIPEAIKEIVFDAIEEITEIGDDAVEAVDAGVDSVVGGADADADAETEADDSDADADFETEDSEEDTEMSDTEEQEDMGIFDDNGNSDLTKKELHKEDIDSLMESGGIDAVIAELSDMTVPKLRTLAREYKDFAIAGREISKANKKKLIEIFKELYK